MVTGHDSVFVVGGRVEMGVWAMLQRLHGRWPGMLVAVEGHREDAFVPWPVPREVMPFRAGYLLVARDKDMLDRWDDEGYSLMDGAEGPFQVVYEPASVPAVPVELHGDPYGRGGGYRFDPYRATLVTAGLFLVTLVTPDVDSAFSQGLLAMLGEELALQGNSQF
ncbi:hypothetical protein AB0J72_12850 [Dactylosporangium sp. NPDC049742]|uniref:hypothetical protein n=1 Tax=Dactylosporangium sp. NPDC049742 TaxID=3154737 RepID=UPI0034158F19